jgi:hypothetical protein
MKITYHIPTEQYGFVELEAECTDVSSNDPYELVARAVRGQGGAGVSDLEFNRVLDKYLATKSMTSEEYESLSSEQQKCIQMLKRAFKRINNDK